MLNSTWSLALRQAISPTQAGIQHGVGTDDPANGLRITWKKEPVASQWQKEKTVNELRHKSKEKFGKRFETRWFKLAQITKLLLWLITDS
jgi:hypothetical protein